MDVSETWNKALPITASNVSRDCWFDKPEQSSGCKLLSKKEMKIPLNSLAECFSMSESFCDPNLCTGEVF